MVSNYFETTFQKQCYCTIKALSLQGKSIEFRKQKIELIFQLNIHYEKRGNLLQVTSFIFMSKPTIN